MPAFITGLYKKAYEGLSRNSWYLSIVMLINRSGTMVIPFMTIYCTQRLHFSIAQAGFIMGLFGLGAITGAYFGGKIIDTIGFYTLQVASLFAGGAMFMVVGYLHHFVTLCIGVYILSICNESFRPANSTAIAHYSKPENRTRSYSLNRLAINLGWGVGGALGGFLASHNYRLLFWVDGSTNIMAAIMLLFLLPRAATEAKSPRDKTEIPEGSSAYRDKTYLSFIALVVLFAFCFFQLFTMLPLFYKIAWHFDEQFIGILMAMNGLIIALIEMILIFKLEGTRPPLYFIKIGILLIGLGFVLSNLLPASRLTAVLSMLLISLGEILSMPFMNTFWISRSAHNNRGQFAALYTMAWSTAQTIAPSIGSQVIQHIGFTILWWVIGILSILISSGFLLMSRKENTALSL